MTFFDILQRCQGVLVRFPLARYGAALAFVLLTVTFRAVFNDVFASGVYFHLYYPAVILSAYLLGAGPGFFAVIASAVLAQGIFGASSGANQPPIAFATFIMSSAVAVFVLAHMRGQLKFLTTEYERIDALTHSQASLFREHAERVSNHMQLISALLQLQARDAAQPDLSRVLMNAASRTMLISRMHRAFARPEDETIDFKAFAVRLADAALAARDRPPLPVMVEGERLHLPLEQATSLGLVLIECVNASAASGERGLLRFSMARHGEDAVFRVVEEGVGADAGQRDMGLLSAVSEQMRGSLVLDSEPGARTLQLSFPAQLAPLPAWAPLAPVH